LLKISSKRYYPTPEEARLMPKKGMGWRGLPIPWRGKGLSGKLFFFMNEIEEERGKSLPYGVNFLPGQLSVMDDGFPQTIKNRSNGNEDDPKNDRWVEGRCARVVVEFRFKTHIQGVKDRTRGDDYVT